MILLNIRNITAWITFVSLCITKNILVTILHKQKGDKMKHYVIFCESSDQNEMVQIKILAKGYTWVSGFKLTQFTDKSVLVFDDLNSSDRAISYHEKLITEEYKKHSCYKNHRVIGAEAFLKLVRF